MKQLLCLIKKIRWGYLLSVVGMIYYGSGMLFYFMTKGHAGIPLESGLPEFTLAAAIFRTRKAVDRVDAKLDPNAGQ